MAPLYEISLSLKLDSEMSQEVSDIYKNQPGRRKWGVSQFYRPEIQKFKKIQGHSSFILIIY
jgi:hypothetical protein